jgi:sigma-B regulation protein RsbU (phosphoserine phosphatase)
MSVSSGGHPAALAWRAGDRPAPVGDSGSLVGAFEETSFTTVDVDLTEGDAVFLYTDGLSEARRGDDHFGDVLLERLMAHGPEPASLVQGLLEDVLSFQDGDPHDDIAVLALRVPMTHV